MKIQDGLSAKPAPLFIYELSSHQLETVKVSPRIGIVLNLFEEHLDHYISFMAYQMAKVSIAKYQTKDDYFIYSKDNLILASRIKECKTKAVIMPFSINKSDSGSYIWGNKILLSNGSEVEIDLDRIPLAGEHNLKNVLAALNACTLLGLSADKLVDSLYQFTPLPHRLEWLGEYGGIQFVNDSIATIPEATINAIKTYDNLETLILGGFNRCIDYTLLVEYLRENEVKNLIMLGEVGELLKEELNEAQYQSSIFNAKDMDEVVKLVFEHTSEGKLCLLSPAASSYDSFKDFEDRGDQYKKKVREYSSHL